MDIRGAGGTLVSFDGRFVTITRSGFLSRVGGVKGERRIPVASITAVEWKPATRMINGFIHFAVPGSTSARGGRRADSGLQSQDEDGVIFTWQQRAAFEDLRAAVEQAIQSARNQSPAPPPPDPPTHSPTPSDPRTQLRQLQELRDEGLITDAEYEAKRAEVLRRI